ncbi:hypothetical protein ACH5RR_006199 [Cinchona calisaya]|uniref:Uncharacterized protein n=1 Tax=Cinchona calisaya TaxID=153742 RepID=A0ABD3ANB7_9GENT
MCVPLTRLGYYVRGITLAVVRRRDHNGQIVGTTDAANLDRLGSEPIDLPSLKVHAAGGDSSRTICSGRLKKESHRLKKKILFSAKTKIRWRPRALRQTRGRA